MDFLHGDFDNDLIPTIGNDGYIEFGKNRYPSPMVLKAIDESAYEDAFILWLNDTWLPPRIDLLNTTLNSYKNNRDRYDEILSIIKNDNMVPFVGSGMSISSNFSSWTQFLYDLHKNSTLDQNELNDLLKQGNFEDAATRLFESMPERLFNERFERTFKEIKYDDICGPIRFFTKIFKTHIITTNYDNVLESVYSNGGETINKILYGKNICNFRRFRNVERCLLKLHGDYQDPQTRVLTKDEYDTFYEDGGDTREEFSILLRNNSLLFLGCSLGNDRTVQVIEQVATLDRNIPRYFAFLKSPKDEQERIDREHFLTDKNIFPVWYNDDHDECIEALFVGIINKMGGF
jgi:hypothetical protein